MTLPSLRRGAPVILALLAVTVGAACGGTTFDSAATVTFPESKVPAVTVGNAEFRDQLRAIVSNPGYAALANAWGLDAVIAAGDVTTPAALSAFWLEQELRWGVYEAEFTDLGLTLDDAARSEASQLWDQTFQSSGADFSTFPKSFRNRLVEQLAKYLAVKQYYADVTPEKVKRFYERFEAQICPARRSVAHILVTDEATAREVLDKLVQGGSFAQLAQEYSIDEGSKPGGGALGCATPGAFVPEFEAAVTAAPIGTPVGPVKTEFGFHVIVVGPSTFDDVADQLASALQSSADPRAGGDPLAVSLLVRSARVRVDPRYGTGSVAKDQQGGDRLRVTPPGCPTPADRRGGVLELPVNPAAPSPCTPGSGDEPSDPTGADG